MRKKVRSKRLAALLLTAALTITEAFSVLAAAPAAAGEDPAGDVAEETLTAGGAADEEEEAVSANEIGSEDAEPGDGEEDLEAQEKNKGTNGVPAQVTGVSVVTDSDVLKGMGKFEPLIMWNYVPGCVRYEPSQYYIPHCRKTTLISIAPSPKIYNDFAAKSRQNHC